MKKISFILVFALLATAVFSQSISASELLLDGETIYTSYRNTYLVTLLYFGKNSGQTLGNVDYRDANFYKISFLSDEQFEVINIVLGRYQKNAGDTFMVVFNGFNREREVFTIICEMTSSTQYKWWAFRGTVR